MQASIAAEIGGDYRKMKDLFVERQFRDEEFMKLLAGAFRVKADGSGEVAWKGEFWGKIMRGAAMTAPYDASDETYRHMEASVRDMLTTAEPDGRVSTFLREEEFHGWDVWCRKYAMLGMQYFYPICRDEELKKEIVAFLRGAADYVMARVNETGVKMGATSRWWGGANSYSILQPIVRLYKMTGERKYYDYAKWLIEKQDVLGENLFRLAYEGKKMPYEYPVTKAYETTSCFEGLLEFYDVCQDARALAAAERFADAVLATDYTVVGGTGCYDELFNHSTEKQVTPVAIHMQETCVTVTLMKFLSELYLRTGAAKYLDAIERSYFNLYAGVFTRPKESGRAIVYSYSPLIDLPRNDQIGGYQKFENGEYCGCCVAIASAGLGTAAETAVTTDGTNVYVNFYLAGTFAVEVGGERTEVRIASDYPYLGKAKAEIVKGKRAALYLRKPYGAENFRCSPAAKDEGAYLVFQNGEGEIAFDMPIRAIRSETCDKAVTDRFAVMKGPIVFAADSRYSDVTKGYPESPIAAEEDGKRVRLGGDVLVPYAEAGADGAALTVWLKRAE